MGVYFGKLAYRRLEHQPSMVFIGACLKPASQWVAIFCFMFMKGILNKPWHILGDRLIPLSPLS